MLRLSVILICCLGAIGGQLPLGLPLKGENRAGSVQPDATVARESCCHGGAKDREPASPPLPRDCSSRCCLVDAPPATLTVAGGLNLAGTQVASWTLAYELDEPRLTSRAVSQISFYQLPPPSLVGLHTLLLV